MKITGIQKLTLIDYPEKIACTLFFYGCNFRCGFCHNPELVTTPTTKIYSEEEILEFLKKRKQQLDGVCLTGGEPLMSVEEDFLIKIKNLGYKIKIDTNGSFPEKLKELIDEKLVDYVAMDIKSSRENYGKIANAKIDLEKIEKSIRLIFDFGSYEFRTTVVENIHDVREIEKIGKWLNEVCGKKPKKYFLQGFKNYGKFIDKSYKFKVDFSDDKIKELGKVAENYFEEVGIR